MCTRYALPFVAVVTFSLVLLCGCGREATEIGGRKVVRVWHVWGGTMADGFAHLCDAYQEQHPEILLKPVFASNDLATNQKFFTAVAARKPPEVIFVDGPQVAPWAEWGALSPLTDLCEEAGIGAEDYFPPCWRQNTYRGDVWALTFCADPNFGFVWSKKAFREAGKWLEQYGDSIYDATTPMQQEWSVLGAFTAKDDTLYYHVQRWPGAAFSIGGVLNKIKSAKIMGGEEVKFVQKKDRIHFTGLPKTAPDKLDTVIEMKVKSGEPLKQMLGAGCMFPKNDPWGKK